MHHVIPTRWILLYVYGNGGRCTRNRCTLGWWAVQESVTTFRRLLSNKRGLLFSIGGILVGIRIWLIMRLFGGKGSLPVCDAFKLSASLISHTKKPTSLNNCVRWQWQGYETSCYSGRDSPKTNFLLDSFFFFQGAGRRLSTYATANQPQESDNKLHDREIQFVFKWDCLLNWNLHNFLSFAISLGPFLLVAEQKEALSPFIHGDSCDDGILAFLAQLLFKRESGADGQELWWWLFF